eukprot:s2973_g4.t2
MLSSTEKGGLWIQSDAGSDYQEIPGGMCAGRYFQLQDQYLIFPAQSAWHATQGWERYDRVTLVAYSVRNWPHLAEPMQDTLRSIGFCLPERPSRSLQPPRLLPIVGSMDGLGHGDSVPAIGLAGNEGDGSTPLGISCWAATVTAARCVARVVTPIDAASCRGRFKKLAKQEEEEDEGREPSSPVESSAGPAQAWSQKEKAAAGPSAKHLQPPAKARRPPSATPKAEGPGSAGPRSMSEDRACEERAEAENCEVTELVLDALPFLQQVEGGEIVLPASVDVRTDPTFREIFTKLSQRGSAPVEACRAEAQRFCLDRFDASLRQSEWEQMLQAAFNGAGEELTPGQWMHSCRWAARAARLIMTLRLTRLKDQPEPVLPSSSQWLLGWHEAGGGSKRLMTVDSFTKALSDVAAQCMAPEDVSGGLENFCRRVIVPLNGVLLRSRSEELVSALDLLDKPEVKRLMTDCSTGLNKLFSCYATEPTARRPHWNSDSVTRFAIDFDFLAEVSNLPLQRMFQDACQHTGNFRAAEEKMLVEGFPLFLLMLAKKTHTSQVCNAPEERVPILFQRINAIACTATQAPRFGLAKEQLLPLSREMPGPRRSFSATPGRSDRLEGSRRAEESGLSWDELLGPESFESF